MKKVNKVMSDTEFFESMPQEDWLALWDWDKENEPYPDMFVGDDDAIKLGGEYGDTAITVKELDGELIYSSAEAESLISDDLLGEQFEQRLKEIWNKCASEQCVYYNSWEDWTKIETGVAYRGGSGYIYDIMSVEPINESTNLQESQVIKKVKELLEMKTTSNKQKKLNEEYSDLPDLDKGYDAYVEYLGDRAVEVYEDIKAILSELSEISRKFETQRKITPLDELCDEMIRLSEALKSRTQVLQDENLPGE